VTRFSNRYHFNGGTPADSAHWTTFSDAIVTAEKAIFQPFANAGARIVETVGYAAGSEVPVFTKNYTTDGTLGYTSAGASPGDSAALIRYGTANRSSKNHPIYCFNYYHSVASSTLASPGDTVQPLAITALGVYAAHWISGFSDGSITGVRASPAGHLCTGYYVEPMLTHRDIPR
jgi:hypothetical protein